MNVPNPLNDTPEEHLIDAVFRPDLLRRLDNVLQTNSRLVHYTSAEVGMSIIQRSEIWMRNTTTMNDFTEVQHGQQCVLAAWHSDVGKRFSDLLDKMFPGIGSEIERRYNAWQPDMRSGTYITCVSEHLPEEDRHGRLSMWRAYGGKTGVALVMSLTPFLQTTNKLAAYSSPVLYGTGADVEARLAETAMRLEMHRAHFAEADPETMIDNVFSILRFAALCTKHPAFREEQEWRVIYSPGLERSPAILPDIKSVRGVPQTVQIIPLVHRPEHGLHHADIPSLIEKVIIGPTDSPGVLFEAFYQLLSAAGIQNAHERIILSHIPLRQ